MCIDIEVCSVETYLGFWKVDFLKLSMILRLYSQYSALLSSRRMYHGWQLMMITNRVLLACPSLLLQHGTIYIGRFHAFTACNPWNYQPSPYNSIRKHLNAL